MNDHGSLSFSKFGNLTCLLKTRRKILSYRRGADFQKEVIMRGGRGSISDRLRQNSCPKIEPPLPRMKTLFLEFDSYNWEHFPYSVHKMI